MGWVFDLDGVVWLGDQVIPGAPEALAGLRAAGEPLVFVTNNSYVPRLDVAAKLTRFGIDPGADGADVVTSAMAAATLVQPGARDELERRGAVVVEHGSADAVVVGYDPGFDYDRMRVAVAAVREGARLVATNDDATYPTPTGVIPGGGAILASVVTGSGTAATVAGKPYAPMTDLVRSLVGTEGVAVGDRPDTDGRFARALAFRFALVLSGVTRAEDLPVEPEPEVVAADLAELVRVLRP